MRQTNENKRNVVKYANSIKNAYRIHGELFFLLKLCSEREEE
jgi:hypothetical protein